MQKSTKVFNFWQTIGQINQKRQESQLGEIAKRLGISYQEASSKILSGERKAAQLENLYGIKSEPELVLILSFEEVSIIELPGLIGEPCCLINQKILDSIEFLNERKILFVDSNLFEFYKIQTRVRSYFNEIYFLNLFPLVSPFDSKNTVIYDKNNPF